MRRRRRKASKLPILFIFLGLCAAALAAVLLYPPLNGLVFGKEAARSTAPIKATEPDKILEQYMAFLSADDYASMYGLLSTKSQAAISREDFIARNQNIYEGIEAANLSVTVTGAEVREGARVVSYSTRMDTAAGEISFTNTATFTKAEKGGYGLEWSPQLIFPDLASGDKVRVNTLRAERGCIYDRNGALLAGPGIASSVGFVPGKMRAAAATPSSQDDASASDIDIEDDGSEETDAQGAATTVPLPDASAAPSREADIANAAALLEITPESIQKKLGASYVKGNTFVALKTVPKDAYDLKQQLLSIPGIKIVDAAVRCYPLGEKAAHLTGYIQSISAEELQSLRGKGYHANSVLGKAGLEKIYEDRLRAVDGCEITIVTAAGETKRTLAKQEKKDGEDITLTIDAKVQSALYDQFVQDKSCSVAMNPQTGEVLALVSTPAYDPNDFVLGISAAKWSALNADANLPLLNRFKAALCPGSTMKAVTAAAGLDTGAFSPGDDFGHSGLTWKKDESWGDYYIRTTKEYAGPANVENALTYSDNIFFAKAALKIGADAFAQKLKSIGFEESIPFEYGLYSSIISSTEAFSSEIQLADSGYGQGEILVNPVHLAAIYASFVDGGSIPRPHLTPAAAQMWKPSAFSAETAQTVLHDLVQVVARGTGKEAKLPGVALAGKTGTAEIKQSKDDQNGTELGWFVLFNADPGAANPLLIVSMAEDVKDRGGSHYVVPKVKAVFQAALTGN